MMILKKGQWEAGLQIGIWETDMAVAKNTLSPHPYLIDSHHVAHSWRCNW